MTVNELIAELQVLVEQGHGELDVVATEEGDCGSESTILFLEHIAFGSPHHSYYWKSKPNWQNEEEYNRIHIIDETDYIYLQASLNP